MGMDLVELVTPARNTAVVTSEIQGGVVGPTSALPELAEAARQTALPNIARLLPAARSAGAEVIHCTVYRRKDGRGANRNGRLFGAMRRSPVELLPGTPEAEVVPDVAVAESDIVLSRTHGLSPMAGTDLDPVLRNLGIATLIVTGVSVNVAITNLVMDAVNLGYQVVLPRDAVCGVPEDYSNAVIDNTLSLVASVTTTEQIVTAWGK